MDPAIRQPLLDVARAEAEFGLQRGGISIAAALARQNSTIVARWRNRRWQGGDPSSHGETQCIRPAGRRRDRRELTLVTTISCWPGVDLRAEDIGL